MAFWLTELEALQAVLREVEVDAAAMANLDQVARVLHTTQPGETPDWAVNEAATTGLHRVFLFDGPRDAQGDTASRATDVLGALAEMPGPAAAMYSAVVRQLDGGAKPVSTPAFWSTYFDFLAAPSEFRVLPKRFDPEAMSYSWDSVRALLEAGQVAAAVAIGDELTDSESSRHRRPRTEQERRTRDAYRERRGQLHRLEEGVQEASALLQTNLLEQALGELQSFVVDSDVANEAKGRLPELRRRRGQLESAEHADLFVDVDMIHRVAKRTDYAAKLAATLYGIVLMASAGFRDVDTFWPVVAAAFVAGGVAWSVAEAAAAAKPKGLLWIPLGFAASLAGATYSTGSLGNALLLNAVYFAFIPFCYRKALDVKNWRGWNDMVHTGARLAAEDYGGGVHRVAAIEGASPWVVSLEPVGRTSEAFRRIHEGEAPAYSVGDFVAVDRAGEVRAWSQPRRKLSSDGQS